MLAYEPAEQRLDDAGKRACHLAESFLHYRLPDEFFVLG
jgi:hypothetical protein